MNNIERDARRHAEELGFGTASAYYYAHKLAAAGLTLVPVEPDEATVERMAGVIYDRIGKVFRGDLGRQVSDELAHAVYPAALGR